MTESGAESSPDLSEGPAPGLGLLGIEIGTTAVRLALLDSSASVVTDAVERPIGTADASLDRHAETRLQTALLAALDVLGLSEPTPLLSGVTVGMRDCGVGSGPALKDWLEDLSRKVGEPFVCTGNRGISYAPMTAVSFVRRVFDPLPLHVDRIELAPVAACRALPPMHPGAVTLGSGVAWSARILGTEVLEAYEIAGGSADEALTVVAGDGPAAIEKLEGVEVDPELLRSRNLDLASLAPAVGVAIALQTSPPTNLLAAETVGRAAAAVPAQPAPASSPPPRRDEFRPDPAGPGGPTEPYRPGPDVSWDPTSAGRWQQSSPRDPSAWPQTEPAHGAATAGYGQPASGMGSYPAYGGPSYRDDDRAVGGRPRSQLRFEPPPSRPGFHVSDFVLGALLMLLLVLTAALVLL